MSRIYVGKGLYPEHYFSETANFIAATQQPDGSIPWLEGGVTDTWNHVEAAMGLSVVGRFAEARAALGWLAKTQREDGSWWAAYRGIEAVDATRVESNFVAYVATGLWHYYLASGDNGFVQALWPTVAGAMDYVLALQSPYGEVYWAVDHQQGVRHDALVTGCSSIFKSLECAANLAALVGEDPSPYVGARQRLGIAIKERPERFDRTWESKSRYAMDWYYPVLAGVYRGCAARNRLSARWDELVVSGIGCLCVNDEPWVTVAESSELTIALVAAGERHRAIELFSWLHDFRHRDGSWWTGYVHSDRTLWPDERPTWTAAAVLLAADAIAQHSAAHTLFSGVTLPKPTQDYGYG